MNAGFVCVKVDREERPDIDAVYMNATVALTGQGGWPMTCFLTPDGRPFFCGTYYPKAAFLQLLSAVSSTWRDRRDEVEQASDHIARELRSAGIGAARRRPGGGARHSATTPSPRCCGTRTPPAAVSAAHRNSRPRRCSRRCYDTGSGPARRKRWPLCAGPAPQWPAAGCTTSWPAGSPATASTTPGWYRISRRCCTTTRCCCGSTRTGPDEPAIRWRTGSPARRRRSCSTSCARPTCSPRRWTPTLTAGRARPTCGRPRS